MNYDAQATKILSIANLLGKVLLMSGAETYRVENSITAVCNRFGLNSESFATITCIISSVKKESGETITEVSRIYNLSNNMNKINQINAIIMNIDKYDLITLENEIKKIQKQVVYRNRILITSYFFAAAFFALLFKGNFKDFIVAGLGGVIIYIMVKASNKLKVNNFFINTLGGFTVTIFAALAKKTGLVENSSYATIGILMLLVPGLALTNAIRDLINGDLIAGISRTVEALLIGAALAIGTGLALAIIF